MWFSVKSSKSHAANREGSFKYACYYLDPAIAQARTHMRHPSESLLAAIQMDNTHAYVWMEPLDIFKPILIWYGYAHVQMET